MLKKLLFFACLINMACAKSPVEWVSTTDDERWIQEDNPRLKVASEQAPFDIVLTNDTAQQIDGFGGCFNELGWDALSMLPVTTRDSILKELFTSEGLNFSICRMPMGANDYSRKFYSYNEISGDFEMKHFSINHDTTALLPYIKEALKYNPKLRLWASPWCPPAWMKTNNHYACRPDSVQNDLPPSGKGQEGVNQFIVKPEYLKAYASYFSRFLEAYNAEGISIYAVHVQNEPNSCQVFPSCIWTASALRDFIGKYLGPQLSGQNPETEIWLGTIERPSVENVDTVLTDSIASKFVKGVGFQWAGKEAIPGVHKKYPSMKLMQTETECGNGSNDWKAAEHTWNLMVHYLTNGANAYMYWNFILDETGKSLWGWKQNSMISVDSKTKAVKLNPEYHLMKHLSHFVKPGCHRIRTEGLKDVLAFVNPDGSKIFVVYNPAVEEKTIKIRFDDQSFEANLQPKSFNTFTVKI